MFDADHDISTLNSLITATIDSIDGYRAAAESGAERFAGLFHNCANERADVAARLKQAVVQRGGTPEEGGSTLAGAHRGWMRLKELVTGSDVQAIVDEVERGEDVIKAKFEKAIADDAITPDTKAEILASFASVKAGHDAMRDLKHQLHAAD